MKSGIISGGVKLFIAHFCHQAGDDPVGWVIREGGLCLCQHPDHPFCSCLRGRLRRAREKVNIAINAAGLSFDAALFSEVCLLNFTYAKSFFCVALHPWMPLWDHSLVLLSGGFGSLFLSL